MVIAVASFMMIPVIPYLPRFNHMCVEANFLVHAVWQWCGGLLAPSNLSPSVQGGLDRAWLQRGGDRGVGEWMCWWADTVRAYCQYVCVTMVWLLLSNWCVVCTGWCTSYQYRYSGQPATLQVLPPSLLPSCTHTHKRTGFPVRSFLATLPCNLGGTWLSRYTY